MNASQVIPLATGGTVSGVWQGVQVMVASGVPSAGVGLIVEVAVGVSVNVIVGENECVEVGVKVAVYVRVDVNVSVTVGVGVLVQVIQVPMGVGVHVSVFVKVGVDVCVVIPTSGMEGLTGFPTFRACRQPDTRIIADAVASRAATVRIRAR